jgi:pimeloyl-ACP methyl ester carboxylesterase
MNNPYKHFPFLILLLTALIITSCEEESLPEEINTNEYLLDYELLDNFEAAQLRTLIRFFDPNINTDIILYDVDIYRVNYLTQYRDETTEASGLVCIPSGANVVNFPFFLGFHASISAHNEAPSLFSNPLGTGLEYFGSLGYITLIPDYLGFGAATEYLHPYLVRESVTRVSTDMVRAAEEMMEELAQSYEQNIFMAGYSQGAYNAMATLYALENEEILPDWEVQATAAGGGTYDLESLTAAILAGDEYASPELLAFLIWSYHTYYDLEGGAAQYFREPYASRIPGLFDGNLSLGAIKSELTPVLDELLQEDLLTALRNGDEHAFSPILEENTVPAWDVQSPVNLYHAPADEVLDVSNSQNYLEQLQSAGATNVTFTPLDAPGHRAAVVPMLINTIFWLQNYQSI